MAFDEQKEEKGGGHGGSCITQLTDIQTIVLDLLLTAKMEGICRHLDKDFEICAACGTQLVMGTLLEIAVGQGDLPPESAVSAFANAFNRAYRDKKLRVLGVTLEEESHD